MDEHRFRRVRYVRDDDGSVTRVEPWSIMLTALDTGAILDVVDGRRGTAVKQWLADRRAVVATTGRVRGHGHVQ